MTIAAEPDLTYKKALSRLRGKLNLTEIRLAVQKARFALAHVARPEGGDPYSYIHELDERGCGWWTDNRYRMNCVARFIVNRKGVRLM